MTASTKSGGGRIGERTLSIVKPDGVRKGLDGEVIRRFEDAGLRVVALRRVELQKKEAEAFYAVHKQKGFFESLTDFISSGPVVAMVLEGEDATQRTRQIMGATNPKDAAPGTIRVDFVEEAEQNIVHGSDSPENAAGERVKGKGQRKMASGKWVMAQEARWKRRRQSVFCLSPRGGIEE